MRSKKNLTILLLLFPAGCLNPGINDPALLGQWHGCREYDLEASDTMTVCRNKIVFSDRPEAGIVQARPFSRGWLLKIDRAMYGGKWLHMGFLSTNASSGRLTIHLSFFRSESHADAVLHDPPCAANRWQLYHREPD